MSEELYNKKIIINLPSFCRNLGWPIRKIKDKVTTFNCTLYQPILSVQPNAVRYRSHFTAGDNAVWYRSHYTAGDNAVRYRSHYTAGDNAVRYRRRHYTAGTMLYGTEATIRQGTIWVSIGSKCNTFLWPQLKTVSRHAWLSAEGTKFLKRTAVSISTAKHSSWDLTL